MYPLVRELAAQVAPIRVPVTVTCRVLKLARAPYYRWLANPVTDAEWAAAHRANALFDAHRDDPEFGYRLLADEARDAGQDMCDRHRVGDLLRQRVVERVREETLDQAQAGPAGAR